MQPHRNSSPIRARNCCHLTRTFGSSSRTRPRVIYILLHLSLLVSRSARLPFPLPLSPVTFPAGLKRSASPLEHDLLKRTRLAQDAPSLVAQPSNFKTLQSNPSEMVLEDRPSSNSNVAPIALLYPGFGLFYDVILGRSSIDVTKYQAPVDRLAQAMVQTYEHEHQRRDEGIKYLNEIFLCRPGSNYTISAASIGSCTSDGHGLGPERSPIIMVEFKNELTGISSFPHIQAAAYVARLHVKMATPNLFEQWRLPCLGITIVGK